MRGGDGDGQRVMRGEFTGGVLKRGRERRRGIGEGRLARDPEFGIVREFNCCVDSEITNSRKFRKFPNRFPAVMSFSG